MRKIALVIPLILALAGIATFVRKCTVATRPSEFVLNGSKNISFCAPAHLHPQPVGNGLAWISIANTALGLHGNAALQREVVEVLLKPSPTPPLRTRAQALQQGVLQNYILQSASDNSSTYIDVDSKTKNVDTVRLFYDADNNLALFEDEGTWARSYLIEVTDFTLGYSIVARPDKNIVESGAVIEERLTHYVASLECAKTESGAARSTRETPDRP